jgi:phosphate/sulfate permease
MNLRFSVLEIFIAQLLTWLLIWLANDYLATLLTLILSSIVCAVLLIALIAEVLERSKVPRSYFKIMGVSILAPILAAIFYYYVFDGHFEFIDNPWGN